MFMNYVRRSVAIVLPHIRQNGFHRKIPKLYPQIFINNLNIFIRHKHSSRTDGNRGKKNYDKRQQTINENDDEEIDDETLDLDDSEYDLLANNAMHVTKNIQNEQNVLVIQPYIKWGPRKSATTPDLLLEEAEALIRSLPKWSIEMSIKVPLESLDKKSFFGKGKIEEIQTSLKILKANGRRVTCIFVSKGTLSGAQKINLQNYFGLPIMDRYSVVVQILRLHATSTEAKLQVAMAEIPYIWSQIRDIDAGAGQRRSDFVLTDSQKQLLRNREKKLKNALADVRVHRELLRKKRKQKNYPIIAVVGYTNSGKTSLIKALTNEPTLQPRDQLFATLDVTAHAGRLPCQLEVIFMDTVGFMSDIPTGLIECFIATLEDAMLADVIIHVQDISNKNHEEQRKHVETTLKSLLQNSSNSDYSKLLETVINVGNKIDKLDEESVKDKITNLRLVSSKTHHGMSELLAEVEEKILKSTNRHRITMKVGMGGSEMAWLYKNAAVVDSVADAKNNQNILLSVVISDAKLQQFKHYFLKNRN